PGLILERGEASVAAVTCESIEFSERKGQGVSFGIAGGSGKFGPPCSAGDAEEGVHLEHFDVLALAPEGG
ncbi:MAG: hypothetical protein ACREI6_08500, partial [Candidatus Rokuibacteriota bacterium]